MFLLLVLALVYLLVFDSLCFCSSCWRRGIFWRWTPSVSDHRVGVWVFSAHRVGVGVSFRVGLPVFLLLVLALVYLLVLDS